MACQGLLDLRVPLESAMRGGRAPLALLAPLVHPPSQVLIDKLSASLDLLDHRDPLDHQAVAGCP